jgi:hypothetical protein
VHATLIDCSLALASCWCLVSAPSCLDGRFPPTGRVHNSVPLNCYVPLRSRTYRIQLEGTRLDMTRTCHQCMAAVPGGARSIPSGLGIILRIRPPLCHRHKMSNGILSLPSKLCHWSVWETLSHPNVNGWKQQRKLCIRYLTPKHGICRRRASRVTVNKVIDLKKYSQSALLSVACSSLCWTDSQRSTFNAWPPCHIQSFTVRER